jgi:hypothetical protein
MNQIHTAIVHEPQKVGARVTNGSTRAVSQLEQIRPSIFILLGGSGQQIGVNLKANLIRTFGEAYRDKIVLLSFDSTEEPFAAVVDDALVRLEPGAEFFNIGQVPISRIKQNLDRHHTIRERLGAHIDRLPSVMRGNGMKMIRPAALVAYHWHYQLIHQELSKAIWRLAGRDVVGPQEVDQEQGMNIYIVGSLVGGTGSGLFLDMAYHVRSLLAELGMQSEYCTVTGLGVLAQAFRGVSGRNLYANGGAALKELTHLMLHENFEARYPNGRVVDMQEAPFNLFYVLDGVDERGRTWNGIQEVAAMAADGLFLQMASQIGRRGDNAFDNVDEILIGRTREGEPTFLSSFGLGYLEFDAPGVAALFTRWLALELSGTQWLPPAVTEAVSRNATEHLQRVTAAQLGPVLRTDPETGGEMYIDMRLPSWLLDKRHDVVAAEAAQYVRAYGRVRIGEEMTAQINRNAERIIGREKEAWDAWLAGVLFAPEFSFPAIADTYKQSQSVLAERLTAGQRRVAEIDTEIEGLSTALEQAEKSLVQAAGGLPIGRTGRIRQALSAYFQAAEVLFDLQLQQAELRGTLLVWSSLAQYLAGRARAVRFLRDRLAAIAEMLQKDTESRLRRLQSNGGARLSLADEEYIRRLYGRVHPGQVSLSTLVHAAGEPLHVLGLDKEELQSLILRQLSESFATVGRMSVEDVLRERSGEMSPRARRRQVFQLATPSWSIDHTRLPDGGAGLERLEILGVGDETDTLFKDDLSRVSTHDPHRIIAYVMVAGAAPSALQQYDQYDQALAQVRGAFPVHVLPEFMTETNQGQLAFALGSIFQLIQNEGAHFYYQPADELQERLRLGQGLANAVDFMNTQEALTREILERVDSRIAHLGLQRSIEILAEYYRTVPEGRTKLDNIARELKRQVRTYSDELRQIREFSGGQQ